MVFLLSYYGLFIVVLFVLAPSVLVATTTKGLLLQQEQPIVLGFGT